MCAPACAPAEQSAVWAALRDLSPGDRLLQVQRTHRPYLRSGKRLRRTHLQCRGAAPRVRCGCRRSGPAGDAGGRGSSGFHVTAVRSFTVGGDENQMSCAEREKQRKRNRKRFVKTLLHFPKNCSILIACKGRDR